jgi:ferredoxin--NADP+ reductase
MSRFAVITDKCTKDLLCLDVCQPVAIHPTTEEPDMDNVTQLYIDPNTCIDCGSCIAVCEQEAIYEVDELPEGMKKFAEINAAYFKK